MKTPYSLLHSYELKRANAALKGTPLADWTFLFVDGEPQSAYRYSWNATNKLNEFLNKDKNELAHTLLLTKAGLATLKRMAAEAVDSKVNPPALVSSRCTYDDELDDIYG